MRNIRIELEYDGTEFCGWQWQPVGRTIQGVLQDAGKQLLQQPIKIIGAGRTDAGVHALGQVANFKCESDLDLSAMRLGLNSYLPEDVRVLSAAEAAERFHSRFDASNRVYRYMISKRPRAIDRKYSWFCKYVLDIPRMKEAAGYLVGSHNFTAFSRINKDEPHYLCDVMSLEWHEVEDEVFMQVRANRFLHNMVRIVVGTLVEVGRGKLSPHDLQDILKAKDRARAGGAVPAHGLFLVNVNY